VRAWLHHPVRRAKRLYEVIVWPVLQLIGKIADSLLDNLITACLALFFCAYMTLTLWVVVFCFTLGQWWMYWTLGHEFRISHHRNFWHRHVKRKP
jgi:hypothetical protein